VRGSRFSFVLDSIRNEYRAKNLKTIQLQPVLEHKYFDLDTDAYGAFVLEAKVMDTGALPGTSTSLANVFTSVPGLTRTLTVAPNLSSQGTYDMNYNFAIQQDDSLTDIIAEINEEEVPPYRPDVADAKDPYQCYLAVVRHHFDDLAHGKYPTIERFQRIKVNGGLPLAAWLQENTTVMGVSRNILADINPPKDKSGKPQKPIPVDLKYQNEAVDGGQMSYIFTVQYTAGIDAKFTLTTHVWNPLAVDASVSAIQTGVLSLYVNGFMTIAALGAKAGIVGIVGRAGPPAPQQVVILNGYPNPNPKGTPTKYPPVITAPAPKPGEAPPVGAEQPITPLPSRGPNRGQLLAPVTPFLLTPGP
jgi:hypothetical protein